MLRFINRRRADAASSLTRTRYRVGQFLRGLRATVTPADRLLVREVLPPPAVALFDRMPPDAQAHSLRVLADLRASGATSSDLAAAALLHDVGKAAADEAGAYLGLWLRGPLVLLEAWRPQWLAVWAAPTPAPTLRYAVYVHLHHPEIGARWAAEAGCTAYTCRLIEQHQTELASLSPSESAGISVLQFEQYQHDLARLQWADGRN